jgi:hypothetical protein
MPSTAAIYLNKSKSEILSDTAFIVWLRSNGYTTADIEDLKKQPIYDVRDLYLVYLNEKPQDVEQETPPENPPEEEEPPPEDEGTPTDSYTPPSSPPSGWKPSEALINDYNEYLAFLQTPEGADFPIPDDIWDYYVHAKEWAEMMGAEEIPDYGPQLPGEYYTDEQLKQWERYQYLEYRYRDSGDWVATDIDDFYAHQDLAQQQMAEWEEDAAKAEKEWTEDEQREWQEYKDLSSYREPGDWVANDIADFYDNYDKAKGQEDIWLERYSEDQTRIEASEEYTDWARERSRYAAEETYTEEARYDPAFYQEMEALQGESVYYQDWMYEIYPRLRAEFEATQPRERGYYTREEARTAAAQTEAEWTAWLSGKMPELEEEFYSYRPEHRGERPGAFQPSLRQVSW